MDTKQTDFSKIIKELIAIGMTNMELADEVGIPQASISHLRTGFVKEPRYSVGEKLMSIHAREMRAYHERQMRVHESRLGE